MAIRYLKGSLGINLTAKRLSFAYRSSARRIRRKKLVFSYEIKDQQLLADALKAAVQEHGLHGCSCTDALPFSLCRMQLISLPYLTDAELLKLTRQRAFWQDVFHVDSHSHGLWWQRLPNRSAHETRVMLTAAPLAALDERAQIIRAAGLHLHRLSLSCFDYCQLSDFLERFCLLVLDESDPICLAVTAHGVEVRHLDQVMGAQAAVSSDRRPHARVSLSRCTQLIQQLFAESPPERLRIVAMQDKKNEVRLNDWQAGFPDCKIEIHSPSALCKGWASNFVDARAAMRLLHHKRRIFQTPMVNFLHPAQRHLHCRLQWLSVLWFVLTIAVSASFMQWSSLNQLRYDEWREKNKLYQSGLSALERIKEQISTGTKELQYHHAYLSRLVALEQTNGRLPFLLSAFEESVPHGVWLTRVSTSDSSYLRIQGTAASDHLVHEFVGNLSSRLRPLMVKVESTRFSDFENGALRQFTLTVRIESEASNGTEEFD